MAQIYDNNDLTWTSRGDYIIGHDGDLLDSLSDPLRSLFQEARTRIMSNIGDWKMHLNLGASISDYVGEPNTKVTAEAIKTRMISSLTRDGFVNSQDIKIKYAPVDIDRIMFRINLNVAPTAINAGSNTLRINALYNYTENNVFVIA